MPSQSTRRLLVLGGIRSGKSELAERLVSGAGQVRYVATAAAADDPEWSARIAAHRTRRPAGWATEETGADPDRLIALLTAAKPDEAVLVDDLGGWLTATLGAAGAWDGSTAASGAAGAAATELATAAADATTTATTTAAADAAATGLAAAVRDCSAAILVLVSPEVGLTVVPPTPAGRIFADAIGTLNRTVAEACDAVALVIAGQPTWIKGTAPTGPSVPPAPAAPPVAAAPVFAAVAGPVQALPGAAVPPTAQVATAAPAMPATGPGRTAEPAGETGRTGLPATEKIISVGMDLPLPDADVATAAAERLAGLDVAGGLGVLTRIVEFAAGTQGQPVPRPWQDVRVLLLHADHPGGVAAGDSPTASARRLDAVERGEGAWALLAGTAGASVQTVRCPGGDNAIEDADTLAEADVDAALGYGWQLADSAVDAGADLIVVGAAGAGADAAAAALIAMTTGGEAPALLGRVIAPGGRIDDLAWMRRCTAVRDALHRVRSRARDPRTVLAAIGGADHAVATGILLGAASRRTPVLLDGPVGIAAALVARDFGAQTRHWLLLPDTGGHPAVRLGAEVLGLTPVLDLRIGLGEGATALAALPMLRSALTLAATLPAVPPRGAAVPGAAAPGTPEPGAPVPGEPSPAAPSPGV